MKDFIESITPFLIILVVILILCVPIWFYLSESQSNHNQECQQRFGKEWTVRGGGYTPYICVNNNGEVKHL